MNKTGIYTADKETGSIIESFQTIAEALLAISKYEACDVIDGTYTPDFYCVVNENRCIIA